MLINSTKHIFSVYFTLEPPNVVSNNNKTRIYALAKRSCLEHRGQRQYLNPKLSSGNNYLKRFYIPVEYYTWHCIEFLLNASESTFNRCNVRYYCQIYFNSPQEMAWPLMSTNSMGRDMAICLGQILQDCFHWSLLTAFLPDIYFMSVFAVSHGQLTTK